MRKGPYLTQAGLPGLALENLLKRGPRGQCRAPGGYLTKILPAPAGSPGALLGPYLGGPHRALPRARDRRKYTAMIR